MDEESAQAIINGAERSFSFSVLRGCVWARKSKKGANRKEDIAITSIIKFSTIVTLNESYWKAEVHKSVLAKIEKNCVSVGFGTKRKSTEVMGIIIKNNEIIFKARDTRDRRCP